MIRNHWYKKDVLLDIPGYRLQLAVAQELFSSHEVDSGSCHLLRSLNPRTFKDTGRAVDYGCGYGVLGLAWAVAAPGWSVDLVDRDALAVAFAKENAGRSSAEVNARVQTRVALDVSGELPDGWDLVLWNVPGKAGESVLQHLLDDVLSRTATGGLVAMVIVNPLATMFVDRLAEASGYEVTYHKQHPAHQVLHVRRSGSRDRVPATVPFDQGIFDRAAQQFATSAGEWMITPVTGLPEYESLNFATELALDMLQECAFETQSSLVFRPGQGHLARGLIERSPPPRIVLVDRDLLALQSTRRALLEAGMHSDAVTIVPDADIPELLDVDLAVIMLEDQVRPVVMEARINQLAEASQLRHIVVAGGSTSVSRFASLVKRRTAWKLRERVKRSGCSVVVYEVSLD